MSLDIHQHLSALSSERGRPGASRLHFGDFLEPDFRRLYAEAHYPRTRPLLITAGMLVAIAVVAAVGHASLSWMTAAFTMGILLPTLLLTLVLSYREHSHEGYHHGLALTAFWVGLVCTSLTIRGSLYGAPYYFGAEVAWIFVVWLVLGLRFRHAAVTAIGVSLIYVWGMLEWDFPFAELVFCSVTLLVVNIVGASGCYQLESAVRNAFLESRKLNELAERDGLTGLYNRRHFDALMQKVWRQSRRDQTQFTLMLLDIDHFKAYNDLYGHQAGDDAMKQVADAIRHCAQRPLDFAARYGGEEFALVLYGPAQDAGREIAGQLRQAVEMMQIPHADSATGPWLTISIGVAIISPGAERSLAGAIQLADEALYQAKEEGRNRVVVKESRLAHIQTGRFRAGRAGAGTV